MQVFYFRIIEEILEKKYLSTLTSINNLIEILSS